MTSAAELMRVLERSPYFKGIGSPTLHGISMYSSRRNFRPGEVLIRQGAAPEAVLLIAQGEVGAEGEGADVFGPGAMVGHLDLIGRQPCAATWTARTSGSTLVFTAADFDQLCQERDEAGSAFRRALIISLSEQLREANQAISAFIAANPNAARPSRGFLDELSGVLSGTRAPRVRKK